ncbi:MAG TPA: hypothetical protein VGM88_23550 [Kofleriaceae bacterium]
MHRLSVGIVAALACLGGCHKKTAPPAAGSGSNGAAVMGPRSPEKATPTSSKAPPVSDAPITLPKGDGTPPIALTEPLPAKTLKRLGALQFAGFDVPPADQAGTKIRIDIATHARPILTVKVFIGPCGSKCTPMTDDGWNAELPRLKKNIRDSLRDLPDLTWEHGWVDVPGGRAFYTYQAAQTLGKDATGNTSGAWTDAYVMHWNNGIESVEIIAQYQDDALSSKQDMLAVAPEADLQKLAVAFFDFYTHQWAPKPDEHAN